MARLIDADKIIFREIDEIGGEYEPYLGCSKSQIDSLPSVTPQEPNIKELGEELRKVREGIKNKKVLIGFNMAVAICNKHLEGSEDKK